MTKPRPQQTTSGKPDAEVPANLHPKKPPEAVRLADLPPQFVIRDFAGQQRKSIPHGLRPSDRARDLEARFRQAFCDWALLGFAGARSPKEPGHKSPRKKA